MGEGKIESFPIAKHATITFEGIVNLDETADTLNTKIQFLPERINVILAGILVVTNVNVEVK